MRSFSILRNMSGYCRFVLFFVLFFTVTVAQSSIPRPEHPKPQFQRQTWLNLNGVYTYDRKLKFNTDRLKKICAPAAIEKSND